MRSTIDLLEVPLAQLKTTDKIPGWMDGLILEKLKELAREAHTIVNIGVWKGRSVAALAETTLGVVWAVDHFKGSPGERDGNHKQAKEDPLSVYYEFCAYMQHFGLLGTKVFPITADSEVASWYFANKSIDLVFIDGGHDYSSVWNDLSNWVGRTKLGGVVCGDDFNWTGVNGAVKRYVEIHQPGVKLEVVIDGKFWMFRRA